MATELEAPFFLPCAVSTKRLEGNLVAPRIKKKVPNHLADTKTYVKVKQNGLLQTQPSVLHFDGYRVGEVHQQTLHIVNASKDNQQMHIIPPTTAFFNIKYSKQRSSLVPGLSLEVVVEFKPTEWIYYYDCIRVHCKGNHNLLIPIHAYPIMNTAKFPRQIIFPPTPIGQLRTKTIPLECDVPIDFEYQLTTLQQHPAYTVTPMKGVVPANGKIDITVTFAPTEFNTAVMKLQLELSQFNSTPVVCTITGGSSPGLAVEQLRKHSSGSTLPPSHTLKTNTAHHRLPPLELTRHTSSKAVGGRTRRVKKSQNSSRATLPSRVEETIVRDGIRFSANLDNTNAVNKVLNQQPGRMKASELRQVTSHAGVGGGVAATQQMKEALFLQQVRQTAAEERANQLRWVTHLGGVEMSQEEKEEVLKQRREAETTYRRRHHISVPESIYHESSTRCEKRKTRRRLGERPQCVPTFDPYLNDTWKRRHMILERFVQGVRKVVIQMRCQKRLERLQQLSSDLKAGKSLQQSLADMSAKDPGVINILSRLPKDSSFIQPFSFPKYIEQNQGAGKQRSVETPATSVVVKKIVPYINLKVPQEYKLMGYKVQRQSSRGSYIPPGLARPLRSGAEDELDALGSLIPGVDPSLLMMSSTALTQRQQVTIASPSTQHQPTTTTKRTEHSQSSTLHSKPLPKSSRKDRKTESTTADDDVCDGEVVDVEGEELMSGTAELKKEVPLLPPSELLQSPHRDPLHVFNPAPGVQMFFPSLPGSEVTLDHTLLPLAIYPSDKQPRVQLDPQDVIPGVMQWRQFPSHFLTTIEGGRPRMSSAWKPTRTDPFSSDMLPPSSSLSGLGLMSGPQPDDFVDENSTEELPVPTMEMVKAQFHLPPSLSSASTGKEEHGSKERALEHVTTEKMKLFDQLGERIRERLNAIEGLAGGLRRSRGGVIEEEGGTT